MLSRLLIPVGILVYIGFILVILTGLRVIKTKVSVHKTLALIAFILATLHGLVVYLLNR